MRQVKRPSLGLAQAIARTTIRIVQTDETRVVRYAFLRAQEALNSRLA
jgi:hypothetical protein